MAMTCSSRHTTHAPRTAKVSITARRAVGLTPSLSGPRRRAFRLRSEASAQERRDVDLVVGDLERGPLAIVDARAAVRRARAPARGAARPEAAAARAVEARG